MSDVDYDEYEDDETEGGNTLNVVRKQLRAEQKARKELEAQLAQFAAKERRSTIADVLKEKAASPALARFVERDVEGDVTPEAVHAWLSENGEMFGWSDPGDDLGDATQEQAQRVSQAVANARPQMPPGGNQGHLERLQSVKGDRDAEAQELRALGFRI